MIGTGTRDYELVVKNKLRGMELPTEGWYCEDVEDFEIDDFVCELCGNTRVRFVHTMRNQYTGDELRVGCICAGAMEGDMENAKARERDMKNRAKRKQHFPDRKWKETKVGGWSLDTKAGRVFINSDERGLFRVNFKGQKVWKYKGKWMKDFRTACYAAFDLMEEGAN